MKRAVLIVLVALCTRAARAQVSLVGRVVDENNAAVPGAQVFLTRAGSEFRLESVADPTGRFVFRADSPGEYLLTAERPGFFRLQDRPVRLAEGANEVTLVLNPTREVFEKVDVSYSPPAIDFDRTTPEERVTGTELLQVPYPSTNTLRNALRTIPGVVQDSAGGIHLNGGGEQQILYTLDGFQINDPLTGRFESRVGVEAVRSTEVSGLNPAEFGKGAAGTLAIRTATGDDRFRYSGTNFIPGLENRKGWVIGGWTPRFGFSGPVRPGRAWFSDSVDVQYDQHVVEELPNGQDRSTSWRVNNLLRNQFNLTPSNILYTGFLTSFWIAPRNGLGALDPMETTTDHRTRQWFFNLKDQVYFHRGALFEIGYAANRTFGREIPQGHSLLINAADGRHGDSFIDATRKGGRDQFLANLFLPSFTALGGHQVKIGIDLDAVNYWQDVTRTGCLFLRADNTSSRLVTFGGSGQLRLSNSEASWYAQDSWKVRPRLQLQIGLRQDWDRLAGNANLSPRIGFSWAPPHLESTKISGGYGIVYEATSLEVFSQPLDQYSLTTHYLADGTPAYGPAVSVFTIGPGPFKTPRYATWNLGAERRLAADIYLRLQYLGRRGRDGFSYRNTIGPDSPTPPDLVARFGTLPFDAVYVLGNLRRDAYDGFEATVRQAFHKQYEWLASYTRSRAYSTAVLDISVDDPLLVSANAGRMSWDAPNRFLSWGYLPTRWPNWAVAYLLEARSGYPFSIQNEAGQILGSPNDHRFPAFFELNLHLERRFVFRKNRWALRFGFVNITGHKNPNEVNADTGSPQFLSFYSGQSRAFTFRIRWLGR
ncbi:MAG: TonB-dependent receptor [Bryobacteraceae bacterium]